MLGSSAALNTTLSVGIETLHEDNTESASAMNSTATQSAAKEEHYRWCSRTK